MTRERAKELLPAIEFWANGGDLWWYNHIIKEWQKYLTCDIDFNDLEPNEIVIGDCHLEARKAYALSKPIEVKRGLSMEWEPVSSKPSWCSTYKYRETKPKWYELKENIGKVIMVKDYDSKEWYAGKFKKFIEGAKFPFTVNDGNWEQARLLTDDDIAKEPK